MSPASSTSWWRRLAGSSELSTAEHDPDPSASAPVGEVSEPYGLLPEPAVAVPTQYGLVALQRVAAPTEYGSGRSLPEAEPAGHETVEEAVDETDVHDRGHEVQSSSPETAQRDVETGGDIETGEQHTMSSLDEALQQLLAIEGATGAAIVDYASGMALAQGGNPSFDLGVAAAGNSNVVRAKLATMRDLGVTDDIEDILITLSSQYHLINVLNTKGTSGLFIYLVLNRTSANLALARHKLKGVAAQIAV